ncbi:unnamed protein product [Psylliodes chrysocephalus]|uniref:Multiple inositol polyphosphate phosphatase 1 n=1 Tax=Psylliodes chrysocephalus TaxID=3402493 RepID=A0A9P0CY99_9CUCU|nr:unnamed protein product [Psylliodes chrysocephala]
MNFLNSNIKMKYLQPITICLLLPLISGQLNYPNNDSQNYNNNPNNPNNPNYNANNPNYNSNSPNYNPNSPNYNSNSPNYNSNSPNYNPNNPNYNSNNPNYNQNNSNYNNPNSPNYNPNSPNYNNPNSPNYNPSNPSNPNNPNYNSNNPSYNQNNPNNPSYNPNNQNNPSYNQNNPSNFNQNNPSNYNSNPSFNSQPLDQGDCCEEYCYTQDPEPYLNFGTKTAYDSITRRSGNQHIVPDCTAVQFWSLVRHGTRLPDASTIRSMRNMNKIHEEIARNYEQRRSFPDRGRLCPSDYDLFRRWRFNESINEGNANTLARQGVDDMKLLARRYKAKYPDVLQNYDERSYYFQYSTDDRTHDSFQAYIEGLFEQDAFKVHANTVNGNMLTNPFQNCPNWQDNQNLNSNSNSNSNSQFISRSEVERFKEKPEYQKMIRDVFRRLGFRFTLNATVIEDIYNLCSYEKAWNPQPRSPWCVAFTKEQLKLLEYVEDLKYFYESGYGNKMAEKIGCSSIKDMYERFERTINGNSDGNKATFIFGDTSSLLSALTALGTNKDYNLLNSENYLQQNRRSWKTSTMSPFAGNLVASLYQCNRGEKHRVMFFLNEVPIEFTDCSVGLCNWSTIQQKYENLVRTCNRDDICSSQRGSANKHSASLIIFILTSILAIRL